MPGMNRNVRTIRLIESSLQHLESEPAPNALEALGLLDELRRLERKWNEQVEAGSPRRIDADFVTLRNWYQRSIAIAQRAGGDEAMITLLHEEGAKLEREMRSS